ncbi:endolytic transglycosylase MltG, partial [Patescibacteria group bacterium]|nr:endolytic transglycosylase MltG [Patescibacteria group bacterium]
MKKIKSIIIFIIIILFFAGVIFVFDLKSKVEFEGEKEFIALRGESVGQIARNLVAQDVINSEWTFKFYVWLKGWQSSIQAGTYILTPMSISDVATTLVSGKVDNEISLKFIEGWTAQEIANELVARKIIINSQEFLNLAQAKNFSSEYSGKFSFLKDVESRSLEGFLFPDTYSVYKDATVNDVIIKMLDNFNDKLTPALRTEIKAQGKTIYQVLIMASIIEAEVQTDEDRKLISDILWKRLDSQMPLQVDSSLKYVIGKQDRNALTYAELKIDSLYNTYKYKGLPPTPICNPGESAIRSAIYPKNSDFWFYLSDKQG